MADLRTTYNRIAEQWDRDHGRDDWWVAGMEALVGMLPPGATILDVGCGSGHKARWLADRGYKVYGIDISDGMVSLASKRVPEGDFQVMDMRDAGRLDRTYDAVIAQASLLHIPRVQTPQAVGILATLVRHGGMLYLAVKEAQQGKPLEENKVENDYGFEYERFFSYYTSEEIADIMTNVGLHVSEPMLSGTSYGTRWIQVIGNKQNPGTVVPGRGE